jgi:hypothetical protein
VFCGATAVLFSTVYGAQKKVYEKKRKVAFEKVNFIKISQYIIILSIYKTRNYISIWIAFIKIFTTDVLN